MTSSSRLSSWGTTPIRALIRRPSTQAGKPNTVRSPPEGGEDEAIIRMVVVLPAPLDPRKPKHSDGWTWNSMPLTASNEP